VESTKKPIDTEGSLLEKVNLSKLWGRTTVPLPTVKQDTEKTRD
jgi:hypothetical protein